MKISLITTCLNSEATLRDTISSVLAQDWPTIEHIIVDGGSTDQTQDIIRQYEALSLTEEFRKEHPQLQVRTTIVPNLSLYGGLNRGISMATGDVIGVVHSDDTIYSPNVLSNVAAEMERSGADFLYADGIYVRPADTSRVVRDWRGGRYSKAKIRLGWLPLHTTCYIRSDFYREVGHYDERYKIAADTDFLLRALYEHSPRVAYLRQYVVRMRMGGTSTGRVNISKIWNEDVEIYTRHGFSGVLMKMLKMSRKVPQFVTAKLRHYE